jgi:CRP/FNR family transcriptional regulator, cyclic AMP receptor protein
MTAPPLESTVREHPFFRALEQRHAAVLTGLATPVSFLPDEEVFRTGDRADVFFLIQHGRVALEVHVPERGALVIETLGPGEILGWSWLISPYRWQFDARAVDTVEGVAFDAAALRETIERDHDLGYALYVSFGRVLLERLQATRHRLLDLYGHGPR